MMGPLETFVSESNAIEGIHRPPTAEELAAHDTFLNLHGIGLERLCELQAVIAPGKPLRDKPGLNVRVGNHIAPPGGPSIPAVLKIILHNATHGVNPWAIHLEYETLHPFMDGNGRTGRALWAWHMRSLGRDPFALPFLHRFYYQTLEHAR